MFRILFSVFENLLRVWEYRWLEDFEKRSIDVLRGSTRFIEIDWLAGGDNPLRMTSLFDYFDSPYLLLPSQSETISLISVKVRRFTSFEMVDKSSYEF